MKGGRLVRRIFFLSLALVVLSLCIPWLAVHFQPEEPPPISDKQIIQPVMLVPIIAPMTTPMA